MGNVWGGLFLMGLILPGVVLLASGLAVLRLARIRGRQDPQARAPWQYMVAHLLLGVILSVVFGSLGLLGWLIMPVWLSRGIPRQETPRDPVSSAPEDSTRRGRRSWASAVVFLITGALLPWAIGLGVKAYLDSLGRPTLPVAGFIDPATIPVLILMTLGAWSFPFLVLASAAVIPWRIGLPAEAPGRDSTLPLWWAYAAGVLASVPIYIRVFWEFDTMLLLLPVGTVLLPPMALGYWVGTRIARRGG